MIAQAPGNRMDLTHPRHQPLDLETEAAVIAVMKRGGPAGLAARDRLVNANLKFVVSVARQFITTGMPMEDMINEGVLGMIRAARDFEPRAGYRFISYAVWWVRQSILAGIRESTSTILVPYNSALKAKLKRAEDLEKEGAPAPRPRGRPPKNGGKAALTHAEALEDVERIQRIRDIGRLETLSEAGWEPVDAESDPARGLEARDDRRRARRLLSALEKRPQELEVVRAYFGIEDGVERTLDDVSERIGLSKERVRQIKESGLNRIRMVYGETRGEFVRPRRGPRAGAAVP